ncbi:hypothetical protein EG329_014265 [Mollisiaceae sp. DMI_Dod_QoI]|nr:hypothetical protein EG329_014265 [Helotiales sp. DMI_Dod_QoI]
MTETKILLTGASGYIGGSILAALLSSEHASLKASTITCVVRGEEKAKALAKLGVKTILFNGLDETEVLAEAASQHDVVIHAASGFHTLSARALVLGLAQRKKKTGKEVYYIHTSGTSNVGDRPFTNPDLSPYYPLSDKTDIFTHLKNLDTAVPYAQRTSDIVVTETGLEFDVKTYILMMPSIYGIDTNPLHEFCHVPILIRAALKLGQVPVAGSGSGIWDHVHIKDVAGCYEFILNAILEGREVPSGKEGIFFVETGEHSWRELAERIADAGVEIGALQTREVRELGLDEATEVLGRGWRLIAEIGWASNSRTRADKARELGWKPQYSRKDWETHFAADWEAILESNKTK